MRLSKAWQVSRDDEACWGTPPSVVFENEAQRLRAQRMTRLGWIAAEGQLRLVDEYNETDLLSHVYDFTTS